MICAASTAPVAKVRVTPKTAAAWTVAPVMSVPARTRAIPTAALITSAAAVTATSDRRIEADFAQWAGQQQLVASGVFLAAGDAGRGEQDPDASEYQQWCTGAPHRETAGIVQGDGWTENDSNGRVFDKCPKGRPVERTLRRSSGTAPRPGLTFPRRPWPRPARRSAPAEGSVDVIARPAAVDRVPIVVVKAAVLIGPIHRSSRGRSPRASVPAWPAR